ncbi:acyl-CoA dehydrogenase family protein [Saccharopolyspora gloriosae]|uniref:acyl-CoA dehydrogenase family protein n=1 Tax=Saccharopolyspora gloriosae TaxID=455344 RepID=UPI001FB6527E|nr:acyl-CoA dehydrogenase family protein [Saccharopolyspora gloriosae]
MHFAFTEEQEDLRKAVRALVDRDGGPHVPPPEAPDTGHNTALWRRLSAEIGAAGLAVPEEHGGSGASLVESCLVAEELGRRLVAGPFLGSAVVSAEAVLASGDPFACARLLPGIASGERVVSLAWAEQRNWWSTSDCATGAVRDGEIWLLTGEKSFVLDGAQADAVLVVATTGNGLSLFEAEVPAPIPATALDPTRPMARFEFSDSPARLMGDEGSAGQVLDRCLRAAAVALAAECVGAADRWLGEIVDYVQVREQFGRPIGSFQAVKHRLADLYVAVESARSLSRAASWAVATRDERGAEWAAMAKSFCCETYQDVAAEGIQLHGGIGITWEHEAHLHLKRAHGAAHLFGTPRRHRELLESLLSLR